VPSSWKNAQRILAATEAVGRSAERAEQMAVEAVLRLVQQEPEEPGGGLSFDAFNLRESDPVNDLLSTARDEPINDAMIATLARLAANAVRALAEATGSNPARLVRELADQG
jgi:hypothetical protein